MASQHAPSTSIATGTGIGTGTGTHAEQGQATHCTDAPYHATPAVGEPQDSMEAAGSADVGVTPATQMLSSTSTLALSLDPPTARPTPIFISSESKTKPKPKSKVTRTSTPTRTRIRDLRPRFPKFKPSPGILEVGSSSDEEEPDSDPSTSF